MPPFPWTRWKESRESSLREGATSVPTSRGLIEYATTGDSGGPAVLVIHGTPGGYDQGLITALRIGPERLRVIAPSRPGYLGTALNVGKTPRDQADAYADLLDALSIRRAAIVGLSGGGPSSLQFAAHHADRCAALVLISAVTCKRPPSERPLLWRILLSTVLASDLGAWLLCKSAETAAWASRPDLVDGRLASTISTFENPRTTELAPSGARQRHGRVRRLGRRSARGCLLPDADHPWQGGSHGSPPPCPNRPRPPFRTRSWWLHPVGTTSSFDRTTWHRKRRRFLSPQWQQLPVDFFADGGTSLAGFAVKKPFGLSSEADVGRRHHRVVLRPRNVRVAEGVPEDDVGVLDRAVLLGPARSGRRRPGSGWDSRRRAYFSSSRIRRDPDVMVDEAGPLPPPGVRRGERERVVAGQELVADRLADARSARSG